MLLKLFVAFLILIPNSFIQLNKNSYDFLIISPDAWLSEIEALKQHKESKGIKTIAVGLNEIYSGKYFASYGRDDAEKIKYFIKNAIEEWGIKYVMLVGGRKAGLKEEWHMPVRYVWVNDRSSSWEYERCFLSDLYFADIYDAKGNFSSWDTNNNGYYGEYEHEIGDKKFYDEVDLLPDLYVGRIPAENREELKKVIENIIKYENSPPCNRAILCGGDLYPNDPWNVAEGEYILEKIADRLKIYEIVKIYSDDLSSKRINEEINKGAGFIVFEGAGNHHLWATHRKNSNEWIFYRSFNILQIKNECLPIVLTSGAHLSQFNRSNCFNWLFLKYGKAVASIGSTGLCWIIHGENLTDAFLGKLHVLFCEEIEERNNLGEAWGQALNRYLDASFENISMAFHIKAAEEFIIFGDPTLQLKKNRKINMDRVLHVGGNGPNNYTKIQDAINDSGDGDTIIVHEGFYEENLIINKSLKILGENAKIKTSIIEIYANNVYIEGFSIEGNKKGETIKCYGDNFYFYKNEIYFSGKGLFIIGNSSKIEKNIIRQNEVGIWIEGKGWMVNENDIINNWYGIWAEKSENFSIIKNNFSYTQWYGMWIEGKNGFIEENNVSKSCYPIYIYKTFDTKISKNFISENMEGVQFLNSKNNSFEENYLEKNQRYGVYMGINCTGNKIIRNTFIDNIPNARDDSINIWNENYWSDYIGIKIKILWILGMPYYIPKFSFDWNPSIKPNYL
jgi:parallel beta-helix repeat protein